MPETPNGQVVKSYTTVQRIALTPENGLIVYDTTIGSFFKYEAGAWVQTLGSGSTTEFAALSEPTGFETRTTSSISFNNSTLTFTIAPVGPSFDFWVKATKFTKVIAQTKAISNVEGNHILYFDAAGVLQETTTFSQALLDSNAIVAIISWSVAAQEAIYMADERHGTIMDGSAHYNLHIGRGTVYIGGLALNTINNNQNGGLNSYAQCGVDAGSILDEDLISSIPPQVAPAGIPIFYRTGLSGNWRSSWTVKTWAAGTTYVAGDRITQGSYIYEVTVGGVSGAGPVVWPTAIGGAVGDGGVTWTCRFYKPCPVMNALAGGFRLAYNQLTGGSWQQTEVNNAQFMLIHLLASNDPNQPIVGIQGQATYANITAARTGADNELNSLSLGSFPLVECQPIATLIFETQTAWANVVKATLRSPTTGTYKDWRAVTRFASGAGATTHANLAGLGADDHPQYGGMQNEQWIPRPVGPYAGQGSRGGQANFDGGMFEIANQTQFNRVIISLQSATPIGAGGRVLIYQTPNGNPGTALNPAQLKATCDFTVPATGAQNVEMTPAEGLVSLLPGIIYVLAGETVATISYRRYLTQNYDLFNQGMQAGDIATVFTTAIASNTAPATFNPVAQAVATTLDARITIRLRKV